MADKRESIIMTSTTNTYGRRLSNSYNVPPVSSVMSSVDSRTPVNLDPKSGDIYATGDVSVKVAIEVSEAITGLKALQREAKAATQALAELREEQAKHGGGRSYDE
ncbi:MULTISPECIES: hypothetical protein [Bacillus]|uniref:hypothetical protein n=1 Tax=Bacillus TaxID=1386 RepID=UPI001D04FD19|nr:MULTISPECIES: hypothetical protein [Bacillus amyloliquefaciens group]